MPTHDHLHSLYDARHETPMQQKLRTLAPMPVGCVLIAGPEDTEAELRDHLRTMKACGFTCLKGVMGNDAISNAAIQAIALDEGIWPWWYAEGGWEPITPALLRRLGLPDDLDHDAAMAAPEMIAHQRECYRRRLERHTERKRMSTTAGGAHEFSGRSKPRWLVPSVVGEHRGHVLAPADDVAFADWLRAQYGDLDRLLQAWNVSARARRALGDDPWAAIPRLVREGWPSPKQYRHLRDIMRFNADMVIERRIRTADAHRRAFDPHEPMRAGGEAGVFLPFSARGVDMAGIAAAVAPGGSFYPSMHLAWHFEEVDFEVERPVYMQSALCVDWAKGIWSATWESTGGPQYFSGGKAPFVPGVRDRFPGFTVDERTITQLMLSHLAAGFKGFGLWTWNARLAGWEAGEFALCDRNGQPTERARTAGAIGQAAVRHRRELWQAHKEPLVGVLQDWDNEAIWAAMALTGRDMFREVPIRARIGACRALMDANIPWEHATVDDLRAGLGRRYRALYLSACISLSDELQQLLHDYVQGGGRLVCDLPGACFDEYGRVFRTDAGSMFERTFGCVLHEFAFANPRHSPDAIGEAVCGGFMAEITPTRATVRETYAISGKPAVTEHRLGAGSAVLLGTQAGLDCWRPGNTAVQELLVRHTLGADLRPDFTCDGCLAYRLSAPRADHYFLINDGDDRTVHLDPHGYSYTAATDAITDEPIDLARPITLPRRSGRWVRCERTG
ncbi:MAG: beta-galactosidase trimerization domain-containing protein [Planctomycetota bacterium]